MGEMDLDALHERRRAQLDEGRADAVAKVHARGHLTARERIADLCDSGTFVEHGLHARPATPELEGAADGIIIGVGTVSGRPTAVVSYDYSVLAGTQGVVSHAKLDHILELATSRRWAMVVFAEGGGARAQEMAIGNYGRRVMSFAGLAKLSGVVPLVAVVPGRSFGGHAALAGLCDIVIATPDAVMGIAGPPFVEAATGERLTPETLGPAALHEEVGAIDVLVDDDAAAIDAARLYLELMSWPTLSDGSASTPAAPVASLRTVVPTSSRVGYDVRAVLAGVVDAGSDLELRPRFAPNVVTTLARIGGRAVGVVASQPMWLAGALDSNASDKMARFIQLCDVHRVPLLFLADTPGFLVGPEAERAALVRHSSRPILALAHATVPVMLVVLRKAYGLGYFAMGTRPFDPVLMVAWPSAEFGSMGHRGASVISGEDEQKIRDDHSPLTFAGKFAVDDVIDPADTRQLIIDTLRVVPAESFAVPSPTRPIDAW
ncbi:MAG TPA: carboxyl transferase domain-containing protein [Acidimicrobiales bacterium]|nr:carboxyl transferase domain-containing protein [Acidimicrobiales bacterium]